MKKQFKSVIYVGTILLIAYWGSPALAQPWVRTSILTNPIAWSKQVPNVQLQIKGERFASKFGIAFGLGMQALRNQGAQYTLDALSSILSAEVRVYPFAKPPVKADRTGCAGFSFSRKDKPEKGWESITSGLYLAPGFVYTKTDCAFYPIDNGTGRQNLYAATIREKALCSYIGYHLRIKFVSFDFAYGFQAGKPELNDPWNLVDPTVFSIAYPHRYRFLNALRLQAGLNF